MNTALKNTAPEDRTFASLFCGCGGLDLGFIQSGFRCITAIDNDVDVIENYKQNVGDHVINLDLSRCLPGIIENESIDVLLAGSPCQGFSTAGKRLLDDPRNSLLLKAGEIAVKVRPTVFVVENVPGALSGNHKKYWDTLSDNLRKSGYAVATSILKADNFGVPQMRRRVILLAWNNGKKVEFSLPKIKDKVVLGDVLEGVEETKNHNPKYIAEGTELSKIASRINVGQKLCNVRRGARSIHTWQIPEVFGHCSKKEIETLEAISILRRKIRIRSYGDADPVSKLDLQKFLDRPFVNNDLKILIKKGYVRKKETGYDLTQTFNGKYRRLDKSESSLTVDTRFGSPRYFLHPSENRGFTVREAARIQGFPDSYEFFGSETKQYKMIGNAVPPPLASALAAFIKENIL